MNPIITDLQDWPLETDNWNSHFIPLLIFPVDLISWCFLHFVVMNAIWIGQAVAKLLRFR